MLTPQETTVIDEILAQGWTICETIEHEPDEDGTILVEVLLPLVDVGFADDVEAARAALEDMGEDPNDWIDAD